VSYKWTKYFITEIIPGDNELFCHAMNDPFEIPVSFKGEDLLFPALLLNYGYSYKIEVEVNGTPILFEPDEDRQWRALIPPGTKESNSQVNPGLLEAIVASIEKILQ
jgi:hypothetical protein